MFKIDRLCAGYGRSQVLRDVSLEVASGEMIAVLGRNGVGKSTLVKAAMGLVKATAGSISLEGMPVEGLPSHRRARCGMAYVPQGRDIFGNLSVVDNLKVAAYACKMTDWRARVDRLFEQFPALAAKRAAPGGSLSGGQQQILALARALITEPKLLLLDEPSEGIQPSVVNEIAEVVCMINGRDHISVVLIEQNLDFAMRIASRAYIMSKGEIVRSLPAKDILDDRELQTEYMGV